MAKTHVSTVITGEARRVSSASPTDPARRAPRRAQNLTGSKEGCTRHCGAPALVILDGKSSAPADARERGRKATDPDRRVHRPRLTNAPDASRNSSSMLRCNPASSRRDSLRRGQGAARREPEPYPKQRRPLMAGRTTFAGVNRFMQDHPRGSTRCSHGGEAWVIRFFSIER